MREILFHGKRLDNGAWVEGFLVMKADPLLGIIASFILTQEFDTNGILHSYMDWYKVDPETVGQYTGLIDKNGTKIFEGDILDHTVLAGILTNRGVVVWDDENARWALQLVTMSPCFYMHDPKSVEVIGNIHDNPELLEEG